MLAKTSYYTLKEILKDKSFPLAMIDLDGIDQNFEFFSKAAKAKNKKIRIASKSIRVPYILNYLKEKDKDLFSGIMCYRVKEAEYLFSLGFDDLLIAYPEVSREDLAILAKITKKGCKASIVVDSNEHVTLLNEIGKENGVKINIIFELDGALKYLGGNISLGVRRSSIKSLEDLKYRVYFLKNKDYINLRGIMLYEAQVAGLTDTGPWNSYQNPVKKKIKEFSIPKVKEFRKKSVEFIKNEGFDLEIINGGGSGSIFSSSEDEILTEVTVGSGYLCSHLFSYYEDLKLVPSVFFAIQVCRKSDEKHITCMGGGYIASGELGQDRFPQIFLPKGIENVSVEGFGEVQTPFKLIDNKVQIGIGDPVILRHSKAGELAEHFNHYYIFRNNEIISQEPTYRGLGYNFI